MREDEINHLFKMISNKIRARGDADMKERGLTFSQLQVLITLHRHDGEMSQRELEKELKISHPTIVGLVQRLEKNGYVETWTDETDKRIKHVKQSEKALKMKEEARQRWNDMSMRMFRNLSETEKEELYRMLNVISDGLNEEQGGRI